MACGGKYPIAAIVGTIFSNPKPITKHQVSQES